MHYPRFYFWSMYKSGAKDSGYHITKSQQDENTSKQDSYDRLAQTLNLLANGRYVISVQQKPGGIVKGAAAMDFELTMADAQSSNAFVGGGNAFVGGTNPFVGYVSKEDADRIAEEKFTKLVLKKENEDLKKRVADLEKENKEYEQNSGGVWEQIGGIVLPHLMGRVFPQAAAAAPAANIGTLHTDENMNPTEMELMQQKLSMVLQKQRSYLENLQCHF